RWPAAAPAPEHESPAGATGAGLPLDQADTFPLPGHEPVGVGGPDVPAPRHSPADDGSPQYTWPYAGPVAVPDSHIEPVYRSQPWPDTDTVAWRGGGTPVPEPDADQVPYPADWPTVPINAPAAQPEAGTRESPPPPRTVEEP